MSGVSDAGSIRLLVRRPGVRRTFVLALVGRLTYGMLPLCFLFTARDATGSFARAAAASATLGFATLAMPLQSRLVDRFGQRRVLPLYAGSYIVVLTMTALLRDHSLPALWIGLGLLLGLSGPALGPAMRAQWREITAEGDDRRRAYALDSVGEESLYLIGPLIAGIILATGRPWLGLLLAVLLIACGTTALVTSPYRPAVERGRSSSAEVATRVPIRRLLPVLTPLVLFGAGGAATFVGIAALADGIGRPGLAGVVEAGMATGAVVGGLVWARFGPATPTSRSLALLLLPLGLVQAAAGGLADHLAATGVIVAVGALATSPIFIVGFSSADRLVPARQRTEASTWVSVSVNAGTACGTAGAGLIAATDGAAPFLLAAPLTLCAAVAAGVRGRGGRDGAARGWLGR